MFSTLAASMDEVIPMMSIGGGLILALVGMLGHYARSIFAARYREQSRREIAAYVAEGGMTAEEGERLLDAGLKSWERPRR